MSSLGENDDGEVLEQIASLARRRVLAEFERCELAGDLEDWVGPWFGDEALRERLARHVADGRGVARALAGLHAAAGQRGPRVAVALPRPAQRRDADAVEADAAARGAALDGPEPHQHVVPALPCKTTTSLF